MTRTPVILLSSAAVVAFLLGGWWWMHRHPSGPAPAVKTAASRSGSAADGQAAHRPHPVAAGTGARRLGTVPWAAAVQAALSRQWGTPAAPVWAAPDPVHRADWVLAEPVAHAGALWWALATPQNPLPRFQAVSTRLDTLTTAQIQQLLPPAAGALNQAYDLQHHRAWPLTTVLPQPDANGVMTDTTAEATGTTGAPVGWQLTWDPPIPAFGPQPATPAGLNWSVILPWQSDAGTAPVLVSEGMQWQTTGALVSDGTVDVVWTGGANPVPATPGQTAAFVPAAVAAGLQQP